VRATSSLASRIRYLFYGSCLCLAVAAFMCGCDSTREAQAPTGPHFKVLTYNVNMQCLRPELAVEAILEADADIVCLQETTPTWERYLRNGLKKRYSHMLFRHWRSAGGMAILSELKAEEVAYYQPKAGWFPAWLVIADTPVGQVQILNVHLHPKIGEDGKPVIGADSSTEEIRLREIKGFYGHPRGNLPMIALGDFNEDESGSAMKWLSEKGMTNALYEFDRSSSTWRWGHYVTIEDRFDHILYSDRLHCLEARVVKAGASDHYPVLAVFQSASPDQ